LTPTENGIRQAVTDLRAQVDRLWNEKASREALTNVQEDIHEIRRALESIEKRFADRVTQRVEEQKAADRERKTDRRWMLGTALTASGLVIAAMAILLPAIGGGG
jgi:CHASE3 domain sensor protein